ncbi:MAG: hypothetical protein RLZZ175_2545 [Bacteroidota bacterium]|jgi:hypothetical protein
MKAKDHTNSGNESNSNQDVQTESNSEKEIDYFGFDAYLLAEDVKETMSSLTAKYSNLASEARENGDNELDDFYQNKAIETHLIYKELKLNRNKVLVKVEVEKYKEILKKLREEFHYKMTFD